MSMPSKKTAKKKRRGPKPMILKIEGDWVEAVKRAMKAGKPKAKKKRARRGELVA